MDRLKKMAAVSAVKEVQDGQIVGLGTGSTARFAIIELGRRIREEELDILGVPTSIATEELARKSGIPLTTLQEHEVIDIDIDGADQVDQHLNMIKGGGGAHTREKLVALSSKKLIIIVDESKLTDELNIPVPVEVLPFAWRPIARRLGGLGCSPTLRTTSGAPFVTDNKNFIVDCDFGIIKNPQKLEREINTITGVIENGIFTGMACEVHVGSDKGVRILK
jgi:ribose 5-phosphate isomerase A